MPLNQRLSTPPPKLFALSGALGADTKTVNNTDLEIYKPLMIRKAKRMRKIIFRHGLSCGITTIGEHFLYNYAKIVFRDYDRSSYYTSEAVPNDTIRVSPDNIIHFQPSIFDRFTEDIGLQNCENPVFYGNWDRVRGKFNDRLFYRSLRSHFIDGTPWEDTIIIQRVFDDIKNNVQAWHGAETRKQVFDRCATIDELYDSIRSEGYRSQKELGGPPSHEVTVNIARDGTLIQSKAGKHRLAIAKILNLSEIPIRVYARHHEWETRRNTVNNKQKSHPDLK